MADLIWLNEDNLRVDHPVFEQTPENTQSVFIWDNVYFKKHNYSLKRLVFLYECLLELPVDIYEGETMNTLKTLCEKKAITKLWVPHSINPEINTLIQKIHDRVQIHIVKEKPFVTLKKEKNYTRFFPYWKNASTSAMAINGNIN